MTNYHIFIDGSYFIFYRLFALINWWKLSHKDEPYTNLHVNQEFVEKFKSIFIQKLREIPKKLKINQKVDKLFMYVGKDCPQETIWRHKYIKNYKSNRPDYEDADNKPGEFFKIVYHNNPENLFQKAIPNIKLLNLSHLEADDCIALYVRELLSTKPYDEAIIITSDKDYLQLAQQRLYIYDLRYNSLLDKMQFEEPKLELLYKIILGDKSDNIPSIFPKCGTKKALYYCENFFEFEDKLKENNEYIERYKLNKILIDFNEIPNELQNEFIIKYF